MCVVIIFEGEIGAGKTTTAALFVAQARARGICVQLVAEPVELWERSGALERLYSDPRRRGYEALTYFAASYTLAIANAASVSSDMIVLERSPGSGRLFAEAWRDAFSPMERGMYAAWGDAYRLMLPLNLAGATVVYLKPSLDACMARLAERGRPAEIGISRDYLQKLRCAHEAHFGTRRDSSLDSDARRDHSLDLDARRDHSLDSDAWYDSSPDSDTWRDSSLDLKMRRDSGPDSKMRRDSGPDSDENLLADWSDFEIDNDWFGAPRPVGQKRAEQKRAEQKRAERKRTERKRTERKRRPAAPRPRRGIRQLDRLPATQFAPLALPRQICTITDDGEPAEVVMRINADTRVSRAIEMAVANSTGTCRADLIYGPTPINAAKSTKARFLIIEGEIAAGKSTMTEIAAGVLTAQGHKAVVIPEPVKLWERTGILQQFYQNPKRYAYAAQTFFTATRCLEIHKAITAQPADIYILERSPASDRIFMEMQREMLEPAEMAMYDTWCEAYRLLLPNLECARILYLKPSLACCAERLRNRARPGELKDDSTTGVSAAYQERLRLAHEAFFEKRHPGLFPLMPPSPFGAPTIIGAELADQDFRTGAPREAMSRLILEALA